MAKGDLSPISALWPGLSAGGMEQEITQHWNWFWGKNKGIKFS